MRILSVLLFTLLLTSCVTKKKFNETSASFQEVIAVQLHDSHRQQDSILTLALALERSRGGNDVLLITQDKLQDRLAIQEDELDNLKGNLSSTSSRMSQELDRLKQEKGAAEAAAADLLRRQDSIIAQFQFSVEDALNVIVESLDSTYAGGGYTVSLSAGDLTFSMQEDFLFKPRSVDKLTEQSPAIFRAVMDALQRDPLLKLMIVGHTDNQPNPRRNTNNREYGALRANFLAEEFANTYYLSPNRVIPASQGESAPIQSNATPEGQRANRRIDFILRNNVGNLLRALEKLKE
ncbi:OmpA/MotB family protein [Neolewinella persica]|uniref:OmpA/MotB family protein n=1 Tax=Neolewinella persica TaxID=70998 RepID=UPI0003764E34|nr:OmpA family protein [Neolewinella persica]